MHDVTNNRVNNSIDEKCVFGGKIKQIKKSDNKEKGKMILKCL
jgi:hypothetical protein